MKLTLTLPRVPAGLLGNLLGLCGLAAVAVSVAGLTGNFWWGVLTGGIEAFGLAALVQSAPAEQVATTAPAEPGGAKK